MSEQTLLVDQEISDLLEKGAIQKLETVQEEFLNNLFLVGKDGGKPSSDNSQKNLLSLQEHFKMKGLHCLKFLLEPDDFL